MAQAAAKGRHSWWRAAAPGTAAVLIGVGVARFAYTPMIPELVTQGVVTAPEAAYLGAANAAGYLLGALLGASVARIVGAPRAVRAALVATVLGLALCVPPLGY